MMQPEVKRAGGDMEEEEMMSKVMRESMKNAYRCVFCKMTFGCLENLQAHSVENCENMFEDA